MNWWVFIKCEPKSSQLKEPKTNYFSLCALNVFNTQVSLFELNYWNKWTFPRHSNLSRCTCICVLFNVYMWIKAYLFRRQNNRHIFYGLLFRSLIFSDPLMCQRFGGMDFQWMDRNLSGFIQKYLHLCFKVKRKFYGFGTGFYFWKMIPKLSLQANIQIPRLSHVSSFN